MCLVFLTGVAGIWLGRHGLDCCFFAPVAGKGGRRRLVGPSKIARLGGLEGKTERVLLKFSAGRLEGRGWLMGRCSPSSFLCATFVSLYHKTSGSLLCLFFFCQRMVGECVAGAGCVGVVHMWQGQGSSLVLSSAARSGG